MKLKFSAANRLLGIDRNTCLMIIVFHRIHSGGFAFDLLSYDLSLTDAYRMAMNPADPSSFTHRVLRLGTGRTYHFVDQLPEGYNSESTKTVVLVHGFPDFWLGFLHDGTGNL